MLYYENDNIGAKIIVFVYMQSCLVGANVGAQCYTNVSTYWSNSWEPSASIGPQWKKPTYLDQLLEPLPVVDAADLLAQEVVQELADREREGGGQGHHRLEIMLPSPKRTYLP